MAALVLGISLIPIVIASLLAAPGGNGGQATAGPPLVLSPVTPMPKPAPVNLLVPPGPGALVAMIERPTTLRSEPGGVMLGTVGRQTKFGSPTVVLVDRLSGRWLGVVSTLAGNNRLGWIPAGDASLSRVDWAIDVSLATRRLTVLHAGRAVHRFTVAIGSPTAPTPTGRFAVTDRLKTGDAAGPYGCCILALSAVAPHAIPDWTGGNRIAIHSTDETSTIGQPVSHGCIRLTLGEGHWLIDHIPLGTPTVISSGGPITARGHVGSPDRA